MLRTRVGFKGSTWLPLNVLFGADGLLDREEAVLLAWADINDVSRDDFESFARGLNLDVGCVADAYSPPRQPRLDKYATHYFAILYDIDEPRGAGATQVACFVCHRFLLVLHAGARRAIGSLRERADSSPSGNPLEFFLELVDELTEGYESVLADPGGDSQDIETGLLSLDDLRGVSRRARIIARAH